MRKKELKMIGGALHSRYDQKDEWKLCSIDEVNLELEERLIQLKEMQIDLSFAQNALDTIKQRVKDFFGV